MPYTVDNPPRPAKNWTEAEKKKCVAAANAVLSDDGSEEDAIFACIRAAGRTENPGGKKMFEKVISAFNDLDTWLFKDEPSTKESLDAQIQRIRTAWATQFESPGDVSEGRWIKEVFDDYVIAQTGEGLFKIPYTRKDDDITFGEPTKVETEYVESKSKLSVFKQADGRYRFVGWVTNHFRDNDNPPEILSSEAHREFVEYADKTREYPELWLWHTPGSKVGKADMIDFDQGFVMMSGLFDEAKVGEAFATADEELTMSHGFKRLQHDPQTVITDKYRMVEGSITPSGVEANPWTRFETIKEEPMNDAKKEFLTKYLGEDKVKELEVDTEEMMKTVEAMGVEFKEALKEDEPKKKGMDEDQMRTVVGEIVGPLTDALTEKLQLDALSDTIAELRTGSVTMGERLDGIDTRLKALEQSDDSKLADIMTPNAAKVFSWVERAASRDPNTVLKEDDEEDKNLKANEPTALNKFVDQMAAR